MTDRGEVIIGTIEEVHAHQIEEWRRMPRQEKADLFVDLMRFWRPDTVMPTELLESLNAHDVEYLVVGAAATAIHAQPRYTEDIDLWLRRSEANVGALRRALTATHLSEPLPDLNRNLGQNPPDPRQNDKKPWRQ